MGGIRNHLGEVALLQVLSQNIFSFKSVDLIFIISELLAELGDDGVGSILGIITEEVSLVDKGGNDCFKGGEVLLVDLITSDKVLLWVLFNDIMEVIIILEESVDWLKDSQGADEATSETRNDRDDKGDGKTSNLSTSLLTEGNVVTEVVVLEAHAAHAGNDDGANDSTVDTWEAVERVDTAGILEVILFSKEWTNDLESNG